jgi:hypothetical protein
MELNKGSRLQFGRLKDNQMWTIICLAMGVLGENERAYLRDDLKEVAVYGA